jgi:hypothetical protein
MISLARTHGARADLLKLCTHGPGKSSIMDVYTTFPWDALCAEVAKLQVVRRIEAGEGSALLVPSSAQNS